MYPSQEFPHTYVCTEVCTPPTDLLARQAFAIYQYEACSYVPAWNLAREKRERTRCAPRATPSYYHCCYSQASHPVSRDCVRQTKKQRVYCCCCSLTRYLYHTNSSTMLRISTLDGVVEAPLADRSPASPLEGWHEPKKKTSGTHEYIPGCPGFC